MIRIVIADDHTIVRDGIKQILAHPGFCVVGEACDGQDVMQRVRELEFDVLLLDLSMPKKAGIELIKQVKNEKPKLHVLILSMHEEHQYAIRALRAGAAGYMTKESASAQLLAAIRRVAAGGAFISPAVAEQLARAAMPQSERLPHTKLSDREYQVFHLLVLGRTVSEIAAQISLSVKTVSTHKARLMEKMGITNQTDLIRYALAHRLLDNPGSID